MMLGELLKLAEARAALRPFADTLDTDVPVSDASDIWESPMAMSITFGHLRAARAITEGE